MTPDFPRALMEHYPQAWTRVVGKNYLLPGPRQAHQKGAHNPAP